MNAEFVVPLGERELGGIVKSSRRIPAKNLQSGQTQRTFSFIQAARGRKSRSGAADENRRSRRGHRSGRASGRVHAEHSAEMWTQSQYGASDVAKGGCCMNQSRMMCLLGF